MSLYSLDIVDRCDRLRFDWIDLEEDESAESEENVVKREEEVEEEEVQSKLVMRGEGIWRNVKSRQLHRRETWRDGHVLRRCMVRIQMEKEGKFA